MCCYMCWYMCYSQDQYMFVHTALDELLTCGETEIPAANIRSVMRKLEKIDGSSSISEFQKQFNVRWGDRLLNYVGIMPVARAMQSLSVPLNVLFIFIQILRVLCRSAINTGLIKDNLTLFKEFDLESISIYTVHRQYLAFSHSRLK